MTDAALVFDDGAAAGMGHRRRMAALATALEELGVRSKMVAADAGQVGADLVVVDSYRYRADDPGHFNGGVIAAIDDLARDLACDIVVDPNPGAPRDIHRAARTALVGPAYALVDPSIAELVPKPIGEEIAKILVATGASDPVGAGAGMAAELARALRSTDVCLAVGPWSRWEVPDGVVALRTDSGLAPSLADSDLVVTAGGVTLVEALALGRPTVVVVLADNQRQAARGAEEAGAAVMASVREAPGVAATLAGDTERRRSLAAAASATVDGQGARRVGRSLLEACR